MPGDGINDADSVGVSGIDFVAAVVIESGANVPVGDAMGSIGFTGSRGFEDEDFGAVWSEGSMVEVEGAMELGLC